MYTSRSLRSLISLASLGRIFYNHAYLGRYVGADLIRGGCYDDILIGGYFVRGYFVSDILSADILSTDIYVVPESNHRPTARPPVRAQ